MQQPPVEGNWKVVHCDHCRHVHRDDVRCADGVQRTNHEVSAMNFKIRTEDLDGSTFLVAEGPDQNDVRRAVHERLVAGINGKIDMAFARELVRLGWTPPPGHPVLNDKV